MSARSARRLLQCSALLALLGAAGCEDRVPNLGDTGPWGTDYDAGENPRTLDSDRDGVCDATEEMRGTDPLMPDTDGDGLSDRAEFVFGYRATRIDSPDRDTLVMLTESTEGTALVQAQVRVAGNGDSYRGAFESRPSDDRLGIDSSAFYVRSVASGAIPQENVQAIDRDGEQFAQVFGETELVFDIELAFGTNVQRDCVRAYPFRYNVQRDDGQAVRSRSWLLIVVPDGAALEDAEWCVPEGACF